MAPDMFQTLFVNAAGQITLIVGSLIAGYIAARFAQNNVVATLQATIAESKKREATYEVNTATSKTENDAIQANYDKQFGRKAIQSKYTVDEPTGDLVLDGLHFCSPCFHDASDPPHEIQMRSESNGQFICPKCNQPRSIITIPEHLKRHA